MVSIGDTFAAAACKYRSLVQQRRSFATQFQRHAGRAGVGKSVEHARGFGLTGHACSFDFIGKEDVHSPQHAQRARVGQPIFVPSGIQRKRAAVAVNGVEEAVRGIPRRCIRQVDVARAREQHGSRSSASAVGNPLFAPR